jgi:hypothetical protein
MDGLPVGYAVVYTRPGTSTALLGVGPATAEKKASLSAAEVSLVGRRGRRGMFDGLRAPRGGTGIPRSGMARKEVHRYVGHTGSKARCVAGQGVCSMARCVAGHGV